MDLIEQAELVELAEVFFSFSSSSSKLGNEVVPFLRDFSLFPQDSLDILKSLPAPETVTTPTPWPKERDPWTQSPMGNVVPHSDPDCCSKASGRLFSFAFTPCEDSQLRLRPGGAVHPGHCSLGSAGWLTAGTETYRGNRTLLPHWPPSPVRFCAICGGVVMPRGKGSGWDSKSLPLAYYFSADRVWSLVLHLLSVARVPPSPFAFPLLGSSPLGTHASSLTPPRAPPGPLAGLARRR